MPTLLAISSAYSGAAAAILSDGNIIGAATIPDEIGLAAALPPMIDRLLRAADGKLDLVAVVVGPGSFTGLRAGISLATGIALALGIPLIGVTAAEALAAGLPPLPGRALWTAIHARAGRIFLDQGAGPFGCPTAAIPDSARPMALCGNAAALVAGTLAARGTNVMLTDARTPRPEHVGAVALRRHQGELAPLAALPLYVDAPEAKLPAGGLRPAPLPVRHATAE